jgi:hypothetical protein
MNQPDSNPYTSPSVPLPPTPISRSAVHSATALRIAGIAYGISVFGIIAWWVVVIDILTAHQWLWWTGIHNDIALSWIGAAFLLAGAVACLVCAVYGTIPHRIALLVVVPFYVKPLIQMVTWLSQKLI